MDNDIFKALADPSRRKILELLAQNGDLAAGDISSHFDISAPSVSHHLAILKSAGLVTDTRQRQCVVYSINTAVLQDAANWMNYIFNTTNEGIDSHE